MGMHLMPGDPYVGHTVDNQLEQVGILTGPQSTDNELFRKTDYPVGASRQLARIHRAGCLRRTSEWAGFQTLRQATQESAPWHGDHTGALAQRHKGLPPFRCAEPHFLSALWRRRHRLAVGAPHPVAVIDDSRRLVGAATRRRVPGRLGLKCLVSRALPGGEPASCDHAALISPG